MQGLDIEGEEMNIVEILEECRDMVICWGTQVDDYYQEKWGFDEDLKEIDGWIAEAKAREAVNDLQAVKELEEHEETQYLNLIISMSTDCINYGITFKTYLNNLKLVLKKLGV